MRLPPAHLLVAFILLAGCLGHASADPHARYGVTGTFLALATNAQARELVDAVRAEGGDAVLDGKLPIHFAASGLTSDACSAIQQYLGTLSYLESWTPCTPAQPDAPALEAAPVAAVPANDSSVIASMPVGAK